jgi:hypothetical protein
MSRIQNYEHHYVDPKANLLGELGEKCDEEIIAEIRRYHRKHRGRDIPPEHADYGRIAALYRELFSRSFQKGKDYPVNQYISVDTSKPVNGSATIVFARNLGRGEKEERHFQSGYISPRKIAYKEIPVTSSETR